MRAFTPLLVFTLKDFNGYRLVTNNLTLSLVVGAPWSY